ncbi:MAG: hypothetical protein CYPHOPRED_004595 [Cyphobasidiales sp. Tagirdzhanova-0007]|nr:MAG: hypothetical protein CYPHOPRED_004595 [Cyphobasidiales sp. Tagirdzhanova-0007]
MVPGFRKHKPALSVDSAIQSLPPLRGRDPEATQVINNSNKSIARDGKPTRSFQKVRGSIQFPPLTGIPPDLHRKRYEKVSDSDESDGGEQSKPASGMSKPISVGKSCHNSGPLLQREYGEGAKLSLSLDRTVHYRAIPSAASAWTYHDLKNTNINDARTEGSLTAQPSSSLKSPATTSASLHSNPFSDSAEVASVPRVLLLFTLDLEPNLKNTALGIRENFEFVAISFDFVSSSGNVSSLEAELSNDSYARTVFGRRHSIYSCDMPLVRGFSATDLASTNFLQSFGPSLYRSLHSNDIENNPVVLGAEEEHYVYKSFERRMARLSKPVNLDSDRIAARGNLDGSSTAPTTPLSATYKSNVISNHPSPLTPAFEIPAYGTPSIRVMIKRDTKQETSWTARRFPFVVMLEYPPCAPSIDAKVKLDVSNVRQNLPGISRRDSADPRDRQVRMAGQQSRPSSQIGRPSAAAYAAAEQKARALEEPPPNEELVRIYPRADALSVVSCGAGTVRDTLFTSAVKASRPRPSLQSRSVQNSDPGSSRPTGVSTYREQVTEPISLNAGLPPQKPNYRQMHSKSAMITPGQYRRTTPVSDDAYRVNSGASVMRSRSDTSSHKRSPEDNIEDLFDIVLANWTTAKMQEQDRDEPENIARSVGELGGSLTEPLKWTSR